MNEVKFATFTEDELVLVNEIVERAKAKDLLLPGLSDMDLRMDLSAVHYQCPLALVALAEASEFCFTHDILGIQRHMDRNDGKLKNHFLPRTAIK